MQEKMRRKLRRLVRKMEKAGRNDVCIAIDFRKEFIEAIMIY